MTGLEVPPGHKTVEERPDKRQSLVCAGAGLIRGAKFLAIVPDRTASGWAEKVLAEFLERKGTAPGLNETPSEVSQCS
ncbi:hypothetical protein GCM10011504_22150 [Siccirubricoccus deserti]|nr:hypothetical protein GCM10011504_22150 [Siccirubricoccus deserti]